MLAQKANIPNNDKSNIYTLKESLITNETIPKYMAVNTNEINRNAKLALEEIKANKHILENQWSYDLSKSRTDLLYTKNTDVSVYFNNIVSYIESNDIHPVFKYISKKILEAEKLDHVCDSGLKPDYLNLRIKSIPVSDFKIAKQLMQLVDFLVSKLLKLSNFHELIRNVPNLHQFTNETYDLLKKAGFPPNIKPSSIPTSVMIVMIKWFSNTDLQLSATVRSIENAFLGGDIADEWKGKSTISGDELALSFYDHLIEWNIFFENRPDIIPVLSWARYALQRIDESQRYPFVQCFIKELNECIAHNRLFNIECLIDVAKDSNIKLNSNDSTDKSITKISGKTAFIRDKMEKNNYIIPTRMDRTFQLPSSGNEESNKEIDNEALEKKRPSMDIPVSPLKKRVKIATQVTTNGDNNAIRHSPPHKGSSNHGTSTFSGRKATKNRSASPPIGNQPNTVIAPRNVFRNYEFLPRGPNIHFENPSNRTLPHQLVWCSYCGVGHYPGEHVFVDGVLQIDNVGNKFHIYRVYDTLLRQTGKYPTHSDSSPK